MTAYEEILAKQIEWARGKGIALVGSKGERGRSIYTTRLEDNLFEPLEPLLVQSFTKGDGSEINGSPDSPAKMQALHSSSALGVNVFQHWQKVRRVSVIAQACGFNQEACSDLNEIVFEEKYPIGTQFGIPPNIDVVIHNLAPGRFKKFAIESKFSEAYAFWPHSGLKEKYFTTPEIWEGLSSIYKLAKTISPLDNLSKFLNPAQLIKHILGLRQTLGNGSFQLLYLWFDVPGPEGLAHRNEVISFKAVADEDGVDFISLSYQELIARLAQISHPEDKNYLDYVTDRYLH